MALFADLLTILDPSKPELLPRISAKIKVKYMKNIFEEAILLMKAMSILCLKSRRPTVGSFYSAKRKKEKSLKTHYKVFL